MRGGGTAGHGEPPTHTCHQASAGCSDPVQLSSSGLAWGWPRGDCRPVSPGATPPQFKAGDRLVTTPVARLRPSHGCRGESPSGEELRERRAHSSSPSPPSALPQPPARTSTAEPPPSIGGRGRESQTLTPRKKAPPQQSERMWVPCPSWLSSCGCPPGLSLLPSPSLHLFLCKILQTWLAGWGVTEPAEAAWHTQALGSSPNTA